MMRDLKNSRNIYMNKQKICTLYLVRHGETEWNIAKKIQGQLDSSLTKNGIEGSKELAQKLKHIHFDSIFSSDLLRAQRTAEIIKLDRELEIVTKEALRERTFGRYDGYDGDLYQKEIQHLLEHYQQLDEKEKWRFSFGEGYESDEVLVSRFITLLREIAVGYLEKTVLVVTHGGNLRTLFTHIGYAPYGQLKPGTFKNAGYVKIRSDGTEFFVDEVEGVDKAIGVGKTL